MTTQQKLIKSKMGLLALASYLQNVSKACRVMGYNCDTFYRVKKAYGEGGPEAEGLVIAFRQPKRRLEQ